MTSMRRLIRSTRLVAIIVLLVSLHVVAQQPASAPKPKRQFLMWKVTSPTATVYLVGSMHIMHKDVYPLPAGVEAAFARAKTLVVELNIKSMDKATMAAMIQQHGLYPDGDALSKHISSETSSALDAFCTQYALPRANLERMKPWLVSTLVSVLPYQKAGADPNGGIDMHFLQESQPPQRIDELETAEYQIDLLSSGTEQEQDVSLGYSLKHADDVKLLEAEYLAGDTDAILKRLADMPSKAFMERILDKRNPHMTQKIETYLKGADTTFVVVGAAHVIGEKGIAHALEAKKYKVEKIALDW